MHYQFSEPGIDIKNNPIQTFSKRVEFPIEFLMEKCKPVITEKYEFEYRKKSKLKALFGSFVLSAC